MAMTLRSRIRGELDKVHGATAAARLVLGTIRACLRYRVTGLASEAAFFMLLSLPPLVLGLFGGVGFVGDWLGTNAVSHVTYAIREYAARFLTEDSITQVLLPTVDDVFRGGRFDLVSIGFLLALWSGSRALNVFVDTISIMYGQSGVRGIVRTRALSFSLYLIALVSGVLIIPLVLIGPAMLDGWLPERVRSSGCSTGRSSSRRPSPPSRLCSISRPPSGRDGGGTCLGRCWRCSSGCSLRSSSVGWWAHRSAGRRSTVRCPRPSFCSSGSTLWPLPCLSAQA